MTNTDKHEKQAKRTISSYTDECVKSILCIYHSRDNECSIQEICDNIATIAMEDEKRLTEVMNQFIK